MAQEEDDGKEISFEDAKELYPAFLHLSIHGQENRSQTYYNYLVANSVLILAWSTIFVSPDSEWGY